MSESNIQHFLHFIINWSPRGSPSISLFGGWWSDTKERSEQSDNIQFWSFNEKKKRDKTRKQSDFAFTLTGGGPQIQSVNCLKETVGLCSPQYAEAGLRDIVGISRLDSWIGNGPELQCHISRCMITLNIEHLHDQQLYFTHLNIFHGTLYVEQHIRIDFSKNTIYVLYHLLCILKEEPKQNTRNYIS